VQLGDSIKEMHTHKFRKKYKDRRGKDWEDVALFSLLLFARSNNLFALSEVCDRGMSGSDLNIDVKGGKTVELWKYDGTSDGSTIFPSDQQSGKITAADVQVLLKRLNKSGGNGAFISPSHKFNKPGDFYGIFKTKKNDGHIVVIFQVKDWFKDLSGENDIVESWRKYEKVWNGPITLEDGSTVPVVSILFSANKLQQSLVVRPNEGVVTINGMRNWLPTAAHALQTFTHLREVFPFLPNNTKE
jgi:hypothetical protein